MKLYLIYQIKYIKIITANNNKDKFAKYHFKNSHDQYNIIIYEFFFKINIRSLIGRYGGLGELSFYSHNKSNVLERVRYNKKDKRYNCKD